jgi:uncharacterized protein (DUF2147 family)
MGYRRLAGVAAGAAVAVLQAVPAHAAGPVGEWLVAEKTAHIRIADCEGTLWGVVAWEADPGLDAKNPDPAKRTRPTLGMAVLLGMRSTGPNRWNGAIYNSENGKTYSGGVSMVSDDVLRVRGCILGFLCGGESWMRAEPVAGALPETDAQLCARMSAER